MDSMPPPTATSRSPARMAASRMPVARTPEAQTLLMVSEETSLGMPASICAWREGIWPCPAWSTWPITTCWTCSGSTPARSSAALIAIPPSRGAWEDDSPPPSVPTGVRAVPRITVLGMAETLVSGPRHGRPRHHRSARRDERRHDRGRGLRGRGRRPRPSRGRAERAARRGRGQARLPQGRPHPRRRAALARRRPRRPGRVRPRARAGRRGRRDRPCAGARRPLPVLGAAPPRLRRARRRLRRGQRHGRLRVHDVQEQPRRRRGGARRADRLRPPRRGGPGGDGPRGGRVGQPRARPPEPAGPPPHPPPPAPARDPQTRPPNAPPPPALAERAREIAGRHDTLTLEVMGRKEIEAAGMGAFAGVAQGTYEEPQLITLRYEGPGAQGPTLGYVGKAVTFDSGGISIKPGNKMSDMKFDMSGGAAVLGATAAIARLGLPVRLVSVIGATENLPSGNSMKPGDILRARNGTTIEIINTDAEGRLVLADCLHHAIEQGAERLVDLATLTGAIVTTLGTTYAGLMGTDDDWCEEVTAAGRRAGEILGRGARGGAGARARSCGGCRCIRSTPTSSRAATRTSSTRSRTAAPPP